MEIKMEKLQYRLIAMDLDGTLNNSSRRITPATRDALLAVQRMGVRLVLASGRPAPGLMRECEQLRLDAYHGLLMSYNGGKVLDAATGELVCEKTIPRETAVRLLRHLEQFPVTPIVDDGKAIYTTDPDGFMVRYEGENCGLTYKVVENVADSLDFCPPKILIAAPDEVMERVSSKIQDPFGEEISFVLSTPFYLEATAKGVGKADALSTVCRICGIRPEEVMAFGDGQNDRSMIEFAGLGVAMGNACEELLEAADEVTLTNDEDGIAHTLAKYFPGIRPGGGTDRDDSE